MHWSRLCRCTEPITDQNGDRDCKGFAPVVVQVQGVPWSSTWRAETQQHPCCAFSQESTPLLLPPSAASPSPQTLMLVSSRDSDKCLTHNLSTSQGVVPGARQINPPAGEGSRDPLAFFTRRSLVFPVALLRPH